MTYKTFTFTDNRKNHRELSYKIAQLIDDYTSLSEKQKLLEQLEESTALAQLEYKEWKESLRKEHAQHV